MQVSMNGLRLNLTRAFNTFVTPELIDKLDEEEFENLSNLREFIASLNCVYSSEDKDFSNLSDIPLNEIMGEDGDDE
jgi:hypothetical protein